MKSLYQQHINHYYETSLKTPNLPQIDTTDISLESSYNGYTIEAGFNTNTHTLTSLSISKSDASSDDLGIFYATQLFLINLPIIEVFEHGMLIVERHLRDDFSNRPVKGVVQLENTLESFNIIQKGLRNIIQEYSKQVPNFRFQNHFEVSIPNVWGALEHKDQTEKLLSLAHKYLSQQHLKSQVQLNLLTPRRIEVDFLDIDKSTLPQLLFHFERFLSQTLGFTMEVMFAEKKDRNKKRQ